MPIIFLFHTRSAHAHYEPDHCQNHDYRPDYVHCEGLRVKLANPLTKSILNTQTVLHFAHDQGAILYNASGVFTLLSADDSWH